MRQLLSSDALLQGSACPPRCAALALRSLLGVLQDSAHPALCRGGATVPLMSPPGSSSPQQHCSSPAHPRTAPLAHSRLFPSPLMRFLLPWQGHCHPCVGATSCPSGSSLQLKMNYFTFAGLSAAGFEEPVSSSTSCSGAASPNQECLSLLSRSYLFINFEISSCSKGSCCHIW